MPRYQATVSSAWPVPEIFDYLASFSNAAHWDPGVAAAEQLDPGPVRVGTRFRLQVRFLGRSIPLTYAVTSYDPPRAVVLTAANALLRSVDQIAVTPADGGATISYDADVRLRRPLSLLDPLLSKGFQTVAAPSRLDVRARQPGGQGGSELRRIMRVDLGGSATAPLRSASGSALVW